MNKTELRKEMRVLRDGLTDRDAKSARICRNLQEMPEYAEAKCVMMYSPVRSEVDVKPLIKRALADGKRVVLPSCRLNGEMDAVEYTGGETMRIGAFGSKEPVGEAVDPGQIDLIVCPTLACDARGGRIGYGKGYYDRYLEKVHAFLAAVCYTECIVDCVPMDEYDKTMMAVITQAGVMRPEGV